MINYIIMHESQPTEAMHGKIFVKLQRFDLGMIKPENMFQSLNKFFGVSLDLSLQYSGI